MNKNFGYRIRNSGDHWDWAVLDDSGTVKQQGKAATKRIAAAYVIRELAPTPRTADPARPGLAAKTLG